MYLVIDLHQLPELAQGVNWETHPMLLELATHELRQDDINILKGKVNNVSLKEIVSVPYSNTKNIMDESE